MMVSPALSSVSTACITNSRLFSLMIVSFSLLIPSVKLKVMPDKLYLNELIWFEVETVHVPIGIKQDIVIYPVIDKRPLICRVAFGS